MNNEQAFDLCLGFLGSLLGLAFWLAFTSLTFIVPPLALILLFTLPFCVVLTFLAIGLGGARKRSKWVPIGVLAFLFIYALIGLYEKYEAAGFTSELEKQSTDLDLDGLPTAFLTGHSSRAWGFPVVHESALLKGLVVFVRHTEGIHRFSLDTGSACKSPKSLRATQHVKHRLPPGKCIAVEEVSPKAIHAVEFIRGRSEYKATQKWLKHFGRGFPAFRWSYVPWSVVLHKRESAQTIASGFTGRTQYPFWLPIAYIPFPHREDYGRFGGANLYASTNPIGHGWTQHVFIDRLAEAVGAQLLAPPKTRVKEKTNNTASQKTDDLEGIRERLTILANSPDYDDRVAAANEVQQWIKNGGDLKAIEDILKNLLEYQMHYRKHQLYAALLKSLETVPDWLATLLITIDPDWIIDELGLILLKADPRVMSMIEKLHGEMFLKKLNKGEVSSIGGLVLLLPRFSDKSLSRIYSDCTVSQFEEIEKLLEHMNSKYEHEQVSYSSEEKQRLARHVRPCLQHRKDWNNWLERFEKGFGEIPQDLR